MVETLGRKIEGERERKTTLPLPLFLSPINGREKEGEGEGGLSFPLPLYFSP